MPASSPSGEQNADWLHVVAQCMDLPDLPTALRAFLAKLPPDEPCSLRLVDTRGALVELSTAAPSTKQTLASVVPTHVLQDGDTRIEFHGALKKPFLGAVSILLRHYTRLEAVSDSDYLTGIASRRALDQSISRVLSRFTRSPQPWALVILDLVGFKKVNDTLGHTEGDRRLRAAAKALAGCIRQGDLAARLGGDEFGLLLSHAREENLPTLRQRCATHVRDACGMEFYWGAALLSPEAPPPSSASAWLAAAAQALIQDRRD